MGQVWSSSSGHQDLRLEGLKGIPNKDLTSIYIPSKDMQRYTILLASTKDVPNVDVWICNFHISFTCNRSSANYNSDFNHLRIRSLPGFIFPPKHEIWANYEPTWSKRWFQFYHVFIAVCHVDRTQQCEGLSPFAWLRESIESKLGNHIRHSYVFWGLGFLLKIIASRTTTIKSSSPSTKQLDFAAQKTSSTRYKPMKLLRRFRVPHLGRGNRGDGCCPGESKWLNVGP